MTCLRTTQAAFASKPVIRVRSQNASFGTCLKFKKLALSNDIEEPCHLDEFRCATGGCIPLYMRCNGKQDCKDGSDESNCPKVCGAGQVIMLFLWELNFESEYEFIGELLDSSNIL